MKAFTFQTLLNQDFSKPIVTFMMTTHVAHQDIEKDVLLFKNFIKKAKHKFEKNYATFDFAPYEKQMQALLKNQAFWRQTPQSLAIIFTKEQTYIHPLVIKVDNQYYVSDLPYLLALIKNEQFNYTYNLLSLTRNEMTLYRIENRQLHVVPLPEDAPVNVKIALGDDELTGGHLNFTAAATGAEGISYHGINAKDDEVEIDWQNYYEAITRFLKDFLKEKEVPLYLMGLTENQTLFRKVANSLLPLSDHASLDFSPSDITIEQLKEKIRSIEEQLKEKEVKQYEQLLNGKFVETLVDIKQNAQNGKISDLFISTENLIDGFGENPNEEYDKRQILNQIAYDVIKNGGLVHLLETQFSPSQKKMVAILRY